MPFPRNLDFVGRSDDLQSLHAALQEREPVGIRPAGLTGMGGIGKTQLAVEYVHLYRNRHLGGIFWVNAAEPLARGLAQIAVYLRPEIRRESLKRQIQVCFEELKQRPDALLVVDNIDDPALLAHSTGYEGSLLTLGCHILFTTRHRELGRFHAVEVSVLPEGPALQMLLRHGSRQAVRNAPDHLDRSEAEAICRLLGYLPLALELASAFLVEWPDISLADYRKRLQVEGCLTTVDIEVENLAVVNFQPVHVTALAATLKTQWDALKQDDETARLLLRVAGQFAEATAIPTNMLGIFAGVSDINKPGHPSPLRRALKRLHDVRLVEELREHRVRLHPLVREFAASLTPKAENAELRHNCARRVDKAFEDFTPVEDIVQSRGVDGLEHCLTTALDFAAEAEDGVPENLSSMLRVFRREAHHIREWDRKQQPSYFAQQVLFRAATLGDSILTARAERRLGELARPSLVLRWRTHRESPALVRTLAGHQGWVSSVAVVSGDVRHVVSGSWDQTVAVWDLRTGERLHKLARHRSRVSSVAISPDGRHIVSGSHDQTVAVWDLRTGERLHELAGHRGGVSSVAVSPDGRHIVSGSQDQTVGVWDLRSGERLPSPTTHRSWVSSVAVSPDGRHIVSGSHDRTVRVWDIRTGERLHELIGHRGGVDSVAVSGDGRHIISGSGDWTVGVWDLRTGERLHEFTGHQGGVSSVAVSPDGRHIVSGSEDQTVGVWDLRTGERLHEPTGHQRGVNSVAVSPDGRHIVSGSQDRTVWVWDLCTGERLLELAGHQGWVWSVAMSGDGRHVVSGSLDWTVGVWDLRTGERLHELAGHRSGVGSVAVSPDGRHIVSGSHDQTVAVWDLRTGERLHELAGHRGGVSSVAVSPDGRHIVSGSQDQTVWVWDLRTGERLHELAGHQGGVSSVAVSPDGRHIVSGSHDQTLAVWDLRTGERLHELAGHQRGVNSVAVSPDGQHIVSGSHDRTVSVWGLHVGQRLATLSLDGMIGDLAWHPEGRFLIAGDTGGNLYRLEYRES